MQTVLIVIHVLLAISLIGMVLVQRGPGAAAGAAFGSGASSTVFGSRGAGSFLTRTTAVLAAGFFLVSLSMAVLVSRGGVEQAAQDLGIMGGLQQRQEDAGAPPGAESPESDVPASPQQGQVDETEDVPVASAPPDDDDG